MPTYQYACTECGERLEVVQKFTDDPLTVCPACEGKLRKLFSPVGVVFKGSGFYKTDSRSTAKTGGATKPATESASSGGSATESTTSAPAAASSSDSSSSSSGGSSSGGSSSGSPSGSTPPSGGGAKVS
jgi:putative FmdB family regulatory protein